MVKHKAKGMDAKVVAAAWLLAAGVFHDARAQSVSGTVTASVGGAPLQGIVVTVYMPNETGTLWIEESSMTTESDGSYSLPVSGSGITSASYRPLDSQDLTCRVSFYDPNHVYAREVYDNVAHLRQGTTISVGAEEDVGGINASLEFAATISGTVTGTNGVSPLNAIRVTAYILADEWVAVTDAPTDATGAYKIQALFPGTYRLEFRDWSGVYAREVYNEETNLDMGTSLEVTAGSTNANINASLALGANIKGTLTRSNDTTYLYGITAEAFQKESDVWRAKGAGDSDSQGSYTITGLPAGTYRVVFSDRTLSYIGEVYNNKSDIEAGDDITVAGGETVNEINASLGKMPTIAGKVTGPDGNTPISDILITPYRWEDGLWVEQHGPTVRSGSDGTYLLERLNPGTFRVRFQDDYNGGYLDSFWNGAESLETATDIVVAADATVMDINAWMFPLAPTTPSVIVGILSNGAGGFDVRFTGDVGSVYTLQETTDLTTVFDDWEDFGDPITCQSGTNSLPYTATEATGFVRLRWIP